MKQIYIASYYQNGYYRLMKYLEDVTGHPRRIEIEKRVSIIEFFDTYGAAATRQAFHKSRSTIYLWKQKLKQGGGKLSSLSPKDTAPLHKRTRIVSPFIEDFIIGYRRQHPGVDKMTITPGPDHSLSRPGHQTRIRIYRRQDYR
jgi:hypothetical protein